MTNASKHSKIKPSGDSPYPFFIGITLKNKWLITQPEAAI